MTKKNLILIVAFITLLISPLLVIRTSAQNIEDSGCVPPADKSTTSREQYRDCLRRYKQQFIDENRARQQELKQQRETTRTQLQENTAERCDIVEGRVDERIDQYREAQSRHLARYTALKDRLANLISRLEEEGYDVSELQSDLVVLEEKITTLSRLFEEFVTQLEETTNYECGNSNGDFVTAMQESRNALALVREAALDVKNYYVNTIKPDIIALRDQIRESSQEDAQMLRPSSNTNGF